LFFSVSIKSSLNLIDLAEFIFADDPGLLTELPEIRSFLGAGV